MNIDAELDAWSREWQSATEAPPDLRRKVERQSLLMRVGLVLDILVTVVIGGGATALAVRTPRTDMIVLAVATWGFIAAAWAFVRAAYRGLWSPGAPDTSAFLDLAIRRCRARLMGLKFGAGLFVSEIIFCLAWLYHGSRAPRKPLFTWLFFHSAALDVIWLLSLVFFLLLLWYRRRKQAELACLLEMRNSATI